MKVPQPPYDVWLCDLTHTKQTVASNTIPLAIGSIASYAKKHLGELIHIRLFKYPEELINSFLIKPPHIIGFSNYVWNLDLSYSIASHIKKISPNIVVVFGGPNYPTNVTEQESFIKQKNNIDFYVYREGEAGFLLLLKALLANKLNIAETKQSNLPNCHFLVDGDFYFKNSNARIELEEVPSPYTTGLLDGFFDGQLMPLVQTNRGCPFSCIFCSESDKYFNKVSFRNPDHVVDEFKYIAQHIKGNKNMFIADSNFGMYQQDLLISQGIAKLKETHNFPDYIHVATGKNAKERVLEAARITGGLFRLSASVQSTDPDVLKNIKRQNISPKTIIYLAKMAAKIGSNTYAEIILALPGDNKKAHFKSIEDVINANLNYIRCFTLMLLKGTELNSEETISGYGLVSKYRVLPRCFGVYKFGETNLLSVETEKVCVANNTLTFEDYLECRLFALTIEIFYNDGILSELLSFIDRYDIMPYEFLKRVHDRRDGLPELLSGAYKDFLKETKEELWESEKLLLEYAKDEGIIKKLIEGELGSNLIFKYKALSFIKIMEDIHEVGLQVAKDIIREKQISDKDEISAFLDEFIKYSLYKKINLLECDLIYEDIFQYDLISAESGDLNGKPVDWKLIKPITLRFYHDNQQKEVINFHRQEFGMSIVGIGRILSRLHVKKMYRKVAAIKGNTIENLTQSTTESHIVPV
jgi:radical SAM superfamily enzyme YgiQ (UPF0313 family)